MKTTKNILIISPSNKFGGKASFTRQLIKELNDSKVNYIHIDLIRAKSHNIILRKLEHLISFFFYKIQLVKVLITKPIDLIQIHTSSYFDFYDLSIMVLISKYFKKDVLLRCGGGDFKYFYECAYFFSKLYILKILNTPKKVIVQSDYWYKYYRSIGVDYIRLYIVPNFVDNVAFIPCNNKYQESKRNVLFMPGVSLKGKGFIDIKSSIAYYADNGCANFHIVGSKVNKYIKSRNIVTYDSIFGKPKELLFRQCHIFLLPTYTEGFPNALLEAMAAGMAVITTNIPPIACIVEDNIHCLLMPPGDEDAFREKFEYLINNPKEILRLGTNARKLVEEKYALNKMDNYLKELYGG